MGRTGLGMPLAPGIGELDEDTPAVVLAATARISHVEPMALAISPDGNLVAVGTSIGQVKLYDAHSGELVRTLEAPEHKGGFAQQRRAYVEESARAGQPARPIRERQD